MISTAIEKGRVRAEKVDSEEVIKARALEEIRGFIRKAAEVKEPQEMWIVLRDAQTLLALLLVSNVVLPQGVPLHDV